jgi:hypothetical protein
MSRTPNSFVERRARAMAMVLLTGRQDLSVMEVPPEAGIDLLVSIKKKAHPTNRQFGIILKGSVDPIESEGAADRLLNSMKRRPKEIEAVSTPICFFLFSMSGNKSYHAWRDEPTLSDGDPKLREYDTYKCVDLNPRSLDEIVHRVDQYYDANSNSLAR